MNRLCVVNYGAYDKSGIEIVDNEFVRIINCCSSERVGYFTGRRIKKHTRGFRCFDEACRANELLYPSEKGLFLRDCALAIKKYGEIFGLDFSRLELAVYGFVDAVNLSMLSEMFSMVWLFGVSGGELHNTFEVKATGAIKTPFAVYADNSLGMPDSNVVFNLTNKKMNAINNIKIHTSFITGLPCLYLNEVVRLANLPYEIISFIK